MKKMSKVVALRIITVIMLLSLPLLGSDCEDVINQITQPTGDLSGTWYFIYNAGTTLDVCPGEVVVYPSASGGSATLTCPEQTAITRNYTVSGSTLTYTDTGVEYNVGFTSSNQLVLTGINNNRILYYSNSISDKNPVNQKEGKTVSNYNSSEIIK